VHHSTRLSESDKEEFFSNVLGVEKGPDSEICRKAKKQCWGVPARDLFKSANAEKALHPLNFTTTLNSPRAMVPPDSCLASCSVESLYISIA